MGDPFDPAGIALAVVHASAAVILVLVAYSLVQTSISATVVRAGAVVQSVTAAFVLLADVVLLVLTIREIRSHSHDHGAYAHDARVYDGTNQHVGKGAGSVQH